MNKNFGSAVLATALVRVKNPSNGKYIVAKALIDQGSELNIIKKRLASELGLHCISRETMVTG